MKIPKKTICVLKCVCLGRWPSWPSGSWPQLRTQEVLRNGSNAELQDWFWLVVSAGLSNHTGRPTVIAQFSEGKYADHPLEIGISTTFLRQTFTCPEIVPSCHIMLFQFWWLLFLIQAVPAPADSFSFCPVLSGGFNHSHRSFFLYVSLYVYPKILDSSFFIFFIYFSFVFWIVPGCVAKGSCFTLGVCSWDVFARRCFYVRNVRNRPRASEVRARWPCLWRVLQKRSRLEILTLRSIVSSGRRGTSWHSTLSIAYWLQSIRLIMEVEKSMCWDWFFQRENQWKNIHFEASKSIKKAKKKINKTINKKQKISRNNVKSAKVNAEEVMEWKTCFC